jgi:hypothetical protein
MRKTCQCHSNKVVLAAVQGVLYRRDLSNGGPVGFLTQFPRLFLMASSFTQKNSFAQTSYVFSSPAGSSLTGPILWLHYSVQ